jgi:cell division protease FtsH
MSKQPQPPPPGDKPAPTAPPAPPGWRHWLWPLALLAAVLLFLALPRVGSPPVNLTYSAFLSDVTAHKVKTFTLDNSTGSTAPATGTLKDGKDYTTVVPLPFAGTPLETTLQHNNVQIEAAAPSSGLGTEILYWLILLLPCTTVRASAARRAW